MVREGRGLVAVGGGGRQPVRLVVHVAFGRFGRRGRGGGKEGRREGSIGAHKDGGWLVLEDGKVGGVEESRKVS